MKILPALGINLKDHNADDILKGKRWRVTEKIDGVRRLFYKDRAGKVTAYSRTGKADHWLSHITSYMETNNFPREMIYDTELVDLDLYVCAVESYILRTETNAKASQQYPDNKKDLGAVCFDMFKPDGDLAKGEERHQLLIKTFLNSPSYAPIFQVPCFGVLNGNDKETLTYLMKSIAARNGEGLMLMNFDAPYIHGRSKELVKIKRIEEFVGKVIDMELGAEGTKIEGGIASLICEVPGCTVPVRVGSGFTNAERLYFADNSPIGKLIEIDAFGRTKDKLGDISLSMPIFKKVKEGI